MKLGPLQPAGPDLVLHPDARALFQAEGLDSLEALFAWRGGDALTKPSLAGYRSRFRMELGSPRRVFYMKRFDRPPRRRQWAQWFRAGRRCSCAALELGPALELSSLGIATPTVVAFGEQWDGLFERRSLIVTEQVPRAQSLEQFLPSEVTDPVDRRALRCRRAFIRDLAAWVARFHHLGFRHRDLYLCHIFWGPGEPFTLIDLGRVFRPRRWAARRYQVKDLAQLLYSSDGRVFSRSDRYRFLRAYLDALGRRRDRSLARAVLAKARRMARHDRRHGRPVPYLRQETTG